MNYDRNKNAKVIIPLVLVAWLGGILVFKGGVPAIFEVLFVVAFAVAVPTVVFYLIGEAGWRRLAKGYRASEAYGGEWVMVATGQMALVSVDHADFHKVKMRFVGGALRVASTAEALHLATMLSKVPVLGLFFPELRIPWTAVTRAHEFEAPGWFAPASEPGMLLQVAYDPNYTGKFIEMEIGEPTVFVQLPASMLGEGLGRLPGIATSR